LGVSHNSFTCCLDAIKRGDSSVLTRIDDIIAVLLDISKSKSVADHKLTFIYP